MPEARTSTTTSSGGRLRVGDIPQLQFPLTKKYEALYMASFRTVRTSAQVVAPRSTGACSLVQLPSGASGSAELGLQFFEGASLGLRDVAEGK